jgi:hypothetical protein
MEEEILMLKLNKGILACIGQGFQEEFNVYFSLFENAEQGSIVCKEQA